MKALDNHWGLPNRLTAERQLAGLPKGGRLGHRIEGRLWERIGVYKSIATQGNR